MYQHGSGSEFLEFLFCGNHRHDHLFLGGWVQTNFMGIFLSSADKPRFLATKGFGGEEAAGAEFHNPTSLCCVCKRSQCPAVQGVPMGHTMGHSAPCS